MKKILLLLLMVWSGLSVLGQSAGNEWIQFGGPGKYFVIPVTQSGIHRIDYNTLQNAGLPLGTIDPRNFQVFGREKEQFIFVEGESDGSFDPGDFIEFYAEKNDGSIDSLLYVGGRPSMPDTYYSLYNDTICYYLTWNSSLANRRMPQLNSAAYASFTPSDWFWSEVYKKVALRYYQGPQIVGASSSHFLSGEGWYNDLLYASSGSSQVDLLPTLFPYQGTGAPDAFAKFVFSGNSNATTFPPLQPNHHMRVGFGPANTLFLDTTYIGYRMIRSEGVFPNALLSGAGSRIQFQTVNDLGVPSDIQQVAFSSIRYPRIPDLNTGTTLEFFVPDHGSQNHARIDFQNPPAGNSFVYVLGDTLKRIAPEVNGAFSSVLVPNHFSGTEQRLWFSAESAAISVTQIFPVNGTGDFTDYAQLNPDSVFLIITHSSLMGAAQQYALYRSSPAGGSYQTLVVDVDELYHQYGCGIPKHILGVRRFLADITNEWSTAPSHLFLIGKGIREATESSNGTFPGSRQSLSAYQQNMIPSYGYPSSDQLISAGLNGVFTALPSIPTGRLSASDPQTVLNYLSKMQQYETAQSPFSSYTIPDKEWQKQIMHFGGGTTTLEQSDFSYCLSVYEALLEGAQFGGNVQTFLKQSSDPIDPIEYAEVMQQIQDGVSIMTFFGHSTINGFDQNIDEPSNWNNTGKYPFLVGNACYSGDIFQPGIISASEEFVFEHQKGTIAFLSTSKLGFVPNLHSFSTVFFTRVANVDYGLSVGYILRQTIGQIQPSTVGANLLQENVCTQMTLHGDPALKINYHQAPELVVRQQDVFFNPSTVTLADDSINVNVVVTNIGRATTDTVIVELRRHFPNGSDSIYFKTLNGSFFKDTLTFRIPVLHNIAVGINQFEVLVDIPSFVTEHADETGNNQVMVPLFISSNGIIPVWPYEYAIVPDSVMDLKASTYNPLLGTRTYRFEIDTTDQFNSPVRRHQLVTAPGGVIIARATNWLNSMSGIASPLEFADSTVYFWRVTPDSSVYSWHESSFQYISGLNGWGQAHFYQFEANHHQTMNYSRAGRSWYWDPNLRRIGCDVYSFAANSSEFFGTLWTLDGNQQDYSGCGVDPAIHVAVIDPVTMEPWGTYGCDPVTGGSCPTCIMVNQDRQYGNVNDGCACRNRVEFYFSFRNTNPVEMDSLLSMVNNHIPDGHYVLLYTWRFNDYSTWTPAHYAMMSALGAGDSIYPGRPNESWIVLARKGDPSFTKVVMGQTGPGFVTMNDTIVGFDFTGAMTSVRVGPSSNWGSLYWKYKSLENPSRDSARISVIGITSSGSETLLFDTLFTPYDSILNLGSLVDATTYPYLQLRGWFTDTTFFTPAQVQRWQLVYTPVPEAAVNGAAGFYFTPGSDTIPEGKPFELAIAIENISNQTMDSLLVHYWIEDANRIRHYLTYGRQDSLRPGQILLDTIQIDTRGFSGLNSIWMEVNPVPLLSVNNTYDQLEQLHVNNFAQIPFFVQRDITNPILDVTFDGMHILNGDIVSAKPFILVSLKDENPWMVMNQESDTSFFAVYLTDPSGNQRRIYFRENGQPVLLWYPSSGAGGKFRIEYQPQLFLDGKYTLLIQSSDKSGNNSGSNDYRIQFEVVNRQTITEVLNYPNPFTTRTHFVFTLTGSELPDQMKIQIMTISGKVVREITMDELGPIRIGRNITEFYWDGTDQFGDRLANGVYLYRVVTRYRGQDVEKRESGADEYFTKGIGKMVLMR